MLSRKSIIVGILIFFSIQANLCIQKYWKCTCPKFEPVTPLHANYLPQLLFLLMHGDCITFWERMGNLRFQIKLLFLICCGSLALLNSMSFFFFPFPFLCYFLLGLDIILLVIYFKFSFFTYLLKRGAT